MKLRRLQAFFLFIIILSSSFSSFAEDIYASRGEVADMLLSAADFYNVGVVRSDIIKGYEDGLLHENRNVTRAEALVMLSRAFSSLPQPRGHNKRVSLTAKDFTDIPSWAINELAPIFDSGIVAGTSSGIFSPNSPVTKEQMDIFIKRVYSLYATNIKDDFYATVNKDKLETIKILPGNLSAGTIGDIQIKTTEQIDNIINEIISQNNPQGTPQQKLADFYKSIVDTESRTKEGIGPIKAYLDKIDNVRNITELTMLDSVLSEELCVNSFIKFALTVDFDDSSRYIMCFNPRAPLMNKWLYFEEGANKEAYINYLKTILSLSGESDEEALENANAYFQFEKQLANAMLSAEEGNSIEKIYNIYSFNKLSMMLPDFDLNKVLLNCGLVKDDRIVVSDTKLTQMFSKLYNQSNLDVLKTAMKISLLVSYGSTLNEDFIKAEYELDKTIFGVEGSRDVWQQAVVALEETMPDYLGQIYVEKYFDEESEKDVRKMTSDIIDIFKKRIDNLSWMSEGTKEKAKLKLSTLNVKIGAPQMNESYLDRVAINPPKKGGSYFKNMVSLTKEAVKYYGAMQFSKVNNDMWLMEPYTVNAAYNPSLNDIVLPAAILQSPLYDKNASYEENLGGIGYIIAHEITHAFDPEGAKFDEYGNIKSWWTEEDYKDFDLICQDVIKFFDGAEPIPAVQNNGRLTLNENIADLGAAACITQLASEQENVDFKKLYLSVAKTWLNTSSREYMAFAAQTDVHSNGKLRVNLVLVNFDEFYEAFDINEADGMYVSPEERIIVW